MKKIVLATFAALATANSAFAGSVPMAADVPEISALQGTAAIAAITAIVLLAWERRARS